jgi:hypothetical protein
MRASLDARQTGGDGGVVELGTDLGSVILTATFQAIQNIAKYNARETGRLSPGIENRSSIKPIEMVIDCPITRQTI